MGYRGAVKTVPNCHWSETSSSSSSTNWSPCWTADTRKDWQVLCLFPYIEMPLIEHIREEHIPPMCYSHIVYNAYLTYTNQSSLFKCDMYLFPEDILRKCTVSSALQMLISEWKLNCDVPGLRNVSVAPRLKHLIMMVWYNLKFFHVW